MKQSRLLCLGMIPLMIMFLSVLTASACICPASLGDFVWYDSNVNGIQDPSEPGVAGVTVSLFDNTSAILASTTTDSSGNYLFTNLNPATYFVGFGLPAGFFFSPANQGGDDAVDSDVVNFMTGLTDPITLAAGETNLTIDAGINQVPVPAAVWLLGSGLIGMVCFNRKKRN